MASQREFDFARAGKLNLLEHLDLPAVKGTTRAAMAAVLRAIDCKARDYPTFTITWDELAGITSLHKNTVRRAARGLVGLDCLILHARRHYGWHAYGFQICWSNLQDHRRVDNLSVDPFFVAPDRGTIRHDRGTIRCDRGTMAVPPRNRPIPDQETKDRSDPPTDDRNDADDDRPKRLDFDRVKAELLAGKIERLIGRRQPIDVELAGKLGILVAQGRITLATVENAIKAVTLFEPQNRAAYFFACVDNRLPLHEPLEKLLSTLPGCGRACNRGPLSIKTRWVGDSHENGS